MKPRSNNLITWAAIWILAAFLAVFTIATQSGCPKPKPVIVERIVEVPIACDLPPLTPVPSLPSFESCDGPYPVCMTAETAASLLIHLRGREAWVGEVRALCGGEDLLPLSSGPESGPTTEPPP